MAFAECLALLAGAAKRLLDLAHAAKKARQNIYMDLYLYFAPIYPPLFLHLHPPFIIIQHDTTQHP